MRIRNETRRGLRTAQRDLTRFAARTARIGGGLTGAGIGLAGIFTPAVREFARVEQLLGRFDSVFGKLSDSSGAFADRLAKDINASSVEIRGQLADLQAANLGAGIAAGFAETLSQRQAAVIQDAVAFRDIADKESLRALQSALRGELEPATRVFNADLRQVNVDQQLLAQGINKTAKEATEGERRIARFNLIVAAMGRSGATGAAVREVGTLTAQLRGLRAAIVDTSAAIGGNIGDQISTVVSGLTAYVRRAEDVAAANPQIVQGIALGVPALVGLGGAALTASSGLALLGLAAGGLSSLVPILTGLVVPAAGLVGLGVGAATVVGRFDELKAAGGDLYDSLRGQFADIAEFGSGLISGISDALAGNQLALAAEIGATGMTLAFEAAAGDIREVYNSLVDEISKQLLQLNPSSIFDTLASFNPVFAAQFSGLGLGAAALLRGNVASSGIAASNIIDEDAAARKKEREERLAGLRDELSGLRASAEASREKADADRASAKAATQNRPTDTAATARAAAARSLGTFSGVNAAQLFGPATDSTKKLIKEQEKANQKLTSIDDSLRDRPVFVWG